MRDPDLPAKYPWETPFHAGFFGALFSPEKSIFLFDPLLVLMILLAVVGWKRFSPAVKAYVISGFLLLLAYISFYARYTVWSGDFAWGDRYVSTSAELAALLAVPLLLRYRNAVGNVVWSVGIALCAISAVVQVASLAFWLPLEIYQMETIGHPTFVIVLRMTNIVAFASGQGESLGPGHPCHALGPVGLRSHHYVEFSALPAEASGCGAALGCAHRLHVVECGIRCFGSCDGTASQSSGGAGGGLSPHPGFSPGQKKGAPLVTRLNTTAVKFLSDAGNRAGQAGGLGNRAVLSIHHRNGRDVDDVFYFGAAL